MSLSIDLTGKTVLITGASRGIGAVMVQTFHAAGAAVILHYGQGQAEAVAVAMALGGRSSTITPPLSADRLHLLQADLSVPGAAKELWSQALAWRGSVDVVVNNAATMPAAPLDGDREIWQSAWQRTLQVNLVAVADLCREAAAHFRGRGGTLINLASRAAFRGDGPEFSAYAASKAGVIGLSRTLAKALAPEVKVFAIAPGFVATERIQQVMAERGADYVTRDIPMGAPANPQDIANLAVVLAADLMPHATGATFDINGASYFH